MVHMISMLLVTWGHVHVTLVTGLYISLDNLTSGPNGHDDRIVMSSDLITIPLGL